MLIQIAAFAYTILSRLAYVLFVGITLKRDQREPGEFRRFRRVASFVMYNDAVAFIMLCLLTRNTLALPVSTTVSFITGVALAIVGTGTKLWAARTLGSDAYYWHNFFDPANARGPVATGPYRYVSNPMYTIGYLQTYGFALITLSLPGMIAAGVAQAAILGFYLIVEKPHFEELHR
ncbi:MAG TPA: PEMT/PEM2 methyltransferase family protein [Gemmatimonadales bacterium]|nr:PEMT/PEM2 methyltransferase family protein [Gemmatimonadales bacterium]